VRGKIDVMSQVKSEGQKNTGDVETAIGAAQKPLLRRLRVQLLGLIVFPAIFILLSIFFNVGITVLEISGVFAPIVVQSYAYGFIAGMLGFFLLQQMIYYPGMKTSTFVLPSLLLSFAAVAVMLLLFRVDYSRYVIVVSFLVTSLWLFVIFLYNDRNSQPRLALLKIGNDRGVSKLPGVKWLHLDGSATPPSNIDGVVADLHADLPKPWERLIAKSILAGVPVYDIKNIQESLTGRVDIEHLSENSFGAVLPSKLYIRIKRVVDLICALLLLPVFGGIILVTAIAIKINSPGPVFFVQQRMGYRAQIFNIYKLRSMQTAQTDGEHFTRENDDRITTLGRFIRKYRIDELPQIVNVIKGEMSWIGPRPEAIQLADWYAEEIPFYIYRHAVRPGLSGWAQVNQGNVAELDAATIKLQYDFYYTKYFSPWLDLLIVFRTISTIASGFGSK
jgi:lipopolysaccharide/colanic/teichoic acid biosynthesis glycosyltransferase